MLKSTERNRITENKNKVHSGLGRNMTFLVSMDVTQGICFF